MPSATLTLHLDGTLAGCLERSSTGTTTFTYDEAYTNTVDATPLSLSMPLARRTHTSRTIVPFLQGLLPDSPDRLLELARQFHVSANNPFGLLEHIGRDAAGAVQILPPGEESTDAATRQGNVRRLSDDEFNAVITDLVEHSDTWGQRGVDARWSLPGAQPKVALAVTQFSGHSLMEDVQYGKPTQGVHA